MARRNKTPPNGKVEKPIPRATNRRGPYKFSRHEDRQILLVYLSLVNVQPDLKELYRMLGNKAYSLSMLMEQYQEAQNSSRRGANCPHGEKQRRSTRFGVWGSVGFRRIDHIRRDPHAPPPGQARSPAPPKPQLSPGATVRNPPLSAATRGRDDRRGRARDTAPDTRRAASIHPAQRRLLDALHEEQLAAVHEEHTPPRQQTSRGRREEGRSSRDARRSDTPGPDSYRHHAPYVHVQLPANPRR